MASKKNFEDLDLSQEEIKRISEALKDEKFRKMFVEYAEEISNPENRKRYEEEIAMMEQERGMDVQFVHPQPGYVLKTIVDGEKKAFVNICMNNLIGQPTSKKETDSAGKKGLNWQIPHSFSPPREDFDKNNKTCMVYDVVFHPDTFRMTNNPRFKKMVEDTAIEGIEKQFQCKLDGNNIKHPKLKYKGQPVATVIRTRKNKGSGNSSNSSPDDPLTSMPYPYPDKTSAELAEENEKKIEKRVKEQLNKQNKTKKNSVKEEESRYTTPKYSVVHRGYLELQEFTNARDSKPSTRPKEIVVSIELPLCKSAAGVELDIFEEKLVLKSEKPAYHLDLKLPYAVDDENGSAKFDKARKSLIVTLPVVPQDVQSVTWISNNDVVTEDNVSPPLIEELSTIENDGEKNMVEDELPPLEDIVDEVADKLEFAHADSCDNRSPYGIAYNLPQYDYCQDKETVTFIFHVRNVQEESLSKAFPKQGKFSVKFLSVGSGGFPMHYSFCADFGESASLIAEHTTVDISDKNMTLTMLKDKDCRYIWNSFSAGLNDNTLEVR